MSLLCVFVCTCVRVCVSMCVRARVRVCVRVYTLISGCLFNVSITSVGVVTFKK